MKLVYYTQTEGFPDVKISLYRAAEIVKRFRPEISIFEIHKILRDPNNGEVICSDKVKIWSEEA